MASLQARSPLRSASPLSLINKIISLVAFAVLLGGGWVAVCYLKAEVIERWRSSASEGSAPSNSVKAATAPSQNTSAEVQAITPVKLVYSCEADSEYYHTSTHLPARSERTALSEEAACQRGLKPCSICIAK